MINIRPEQIEAPDTIRLLLGIYRQFLHFHNHPTVSYEGASTARRRLEERIDAARKHALLEVDFEGWIAAELTSAERRKWQRVLERLHERGLIYRHCFGRSKRRTTDVQLLPRGRELAEELMDSDVAIARSDRV